MISPENFPEYQSRSTDVGVGIPPETSDSTKFVSDCSYEIFNDNEKIGLGKQLVNRLRQITLLKRTGRIEGLKEAIAVAGGATLVPATEFMFGNIIDQNPIGSLALAEGVGLIPIALPVTIAQYDALNNLDRSDTNVLVDGFDNNLLQRFPTHPKLCHAAAATAGTVLTTLVSDSTWIIGSQIAGKIAEYTIPEPPINMGVKIFVSATLAATGAAFTHAIAQGVETRINRMNASSPVSIDDLNILSH